MNEIKSDANKNHKRINVHHQINRLNQLLRLKVEI